MLTIEGEKTARTQADTDSVHTQERLHGPFSRSIPLPIPVNPKEVTAEANNGVMHIRLTKSERAKTKHIKVNVE
jgi:HSP20 family protein